MEISKVMSSSFQHVKGGIQMNGEQIDEVFASFSRPTLALSSPLGETLTENLEQGLHWL